MRLLQDIYEILGTSDTISTINDNCGTSPGGAVVRNPPANAGGVGSIPGPGGSHMLQSN